MLVFAIIVLGLAILVLISLFLLKLGQLGNRSVLRVPVGGSAFHHHLWPYLRKRAAIAIKHVWHFILEAKDLKPAATKSIQHQVARVKSVFRIRIRSSEADPQWLPEATELTAIQSPARNPEDLYLEAIRKNPNDQSAYEALGRLYLQNKNYSDAIQTYEFLIHLNPKRDMYYSNLGLAYYSLKDFHKATMAYEKALNINSKIPTRWINLSLCFEALDDHARSVKALLQALQLDKFNINYLLMLADTYIKIPNAIRAEEVLEQVLSIEPTNRTAREKLMKLKI